MPKRKPSKSKDKKPKTPKIDEGARLVTPGINKVPEQVVDQRVKKLAEDLKKIESKGDFVNMPEERTVVLTPVDATPQAGQGGDESANPEDWMISVTMKNRTNSILHIAGLMNLIVSLELIGKSAASDPQVSTNAPAKEIYAHNVNEAQTLAMLHVTQLVVQHQISWDEVLESMVADYMRNIPPEEHTPEKENTIRAQAYGVISTGYEIINRCRNAAVSKVSGDDGVESKSA